jgi:uncharacterized protein (DUF486 family)
MFSAAQLKMIQEKITLVVFSVFSVLYLGEPLPAQPEAAIKLLHHSENIIYFNRAQ